jgi:hypothetical protein
MLKQMWAVAIGGLFAVLNYFGPARATPHLDLTGSFLVQASGTAYFFTCQTALWGQCDDLWARHDGGASFHDGRIGNLQRGHQ